MRHLTALLACLLMAASVQGKQLSQSGRSVAQANQEFARTWYQLLLKKPGNLFVSPISVQIAFGMLSVGAAGPTKSQLVKALNLPADDSTLLNEFQKLLASFKVSSNNLALDLANKVYVDSDFSLRDTFVSATKEFFLAEVESLPLRKESQKSRALINSWAEQHTHGTVKDLLPKGIPDPNTMVTLVSAAYFKGQWKEKFHAKDIGKRPFHLDEEQTVDVDMMSNRGNYEYDFIQDFATFVLKVPYQGNMSMVLIVPRKPNGLSAVEAELPQIDLRTLGNTGEPEVVSIALPRFKLEATLDLKESLKQLGVQDVFSARADLSGLGDGPLYVGYTAQKAFLEVDEEGSEGAAATEADGGTNMVLEANWPFLFLIRHEPSGTVLFLGRYTGPE